MSTSRRIVIVDNDLGVVEVLRSLLKLDGYRVKAVRNTDAALDSLAKGNVHLMLMDLDTGPADGMTFLKRLRDDYSHLPVIVMTQYTGITRAVQAMKFGAFEYVCKPFKSDELRLMIQRALAFSDTLSENANLKQQLRAKYNFTNMIGNCEAIQKVYDVIEKIAPTDSSVLILGESGTGKELVAKAIHWASSRAEKPFVAVNCASLPETLLESELFGYVKGAFTGANKSKKGLFESADGGTLLLDEVGSVPLNTQMSLLRVLQEREIRPVGATAMIPVDVRIIAATNEKLEEKIRAGAFREDLFYRLSVIPIILPPLRERSADIPLLIQHFLRAFNAREGRDVKIARKAELAMRAYSWPGNVRQLENAIYRAGALCENDTIAVAELPDEAQRMNGFPGEQSYGAPRSEMPVTSLKSYVREKEREYIAYVLDRMDGNKELAAEALGISVATLYRKYGDA